MPDHSKRDIIQSCNETTTISVSTGLRVKHRRVTSDDWYSLGVALFLFLTCILLEMLLIDNDDQRFRVWIVFRNELFGLGQKIDPADLS